MTRGATAVPASDFCTRFRRWMPLWGVIAFLNVLIGIALATRRERAGDFDTVRYWISLWLFNGENLYASPISGTDYPPHAIVALTPIALLPDTFAIAAWAILNLVLIATAAWLAARVFTISVDTGYATAGTGSRPAFACLLILFLSWSGTKTLLQFTLLCLVLGLGSMRFAKSRPIASGCCLGLAMMKPQVGLPFLLWFAFTRRRTPLWIGIGTIAGLSLLWCLRAGANPLDVARRYLEIVLLYHAHTGEGAFVGVSKLAPLLEWIMPRETALLVSPAILLLFLTAISVEGWRHFGPGRDALAIPPGDGANRRSQEREIAVLAPALAAVWSLMAVHNLTYGLVVLLPVAAFLMFDENPATRRLRYRLFWLLQIGLSVDVPGIWRRVGPADATGVGFLAADHYRLLLVIVAAGLWAIHRQNVKQAALSG